ncbi:MAG: flagellar basal body L-ring protein FlgH [SAR324 cluster bacterium]|nr:flagellar basal body L-ring protein FlgH [SAR324 cluster bacterium]
MNRMKFISLGTLIFILVIGTGLGGCNLLQKAPPPQKPTNVSKSPANRAKYQRRPRISTQRNLYEGSLWRNESSFGNLLRDHRARFRHDLLTINAVKEIVFVPPPKEKAPETATTDIQKASAALEALSLRDTLEEEQNEILRNLDTISAEVIRVLPNGNMVVRGRKVDHRQRNQVRYVTTVQGILRPADVNDTNVVSAEKLVYPEVKIKRQILGSLLRTKLSSLAPLLGKQSAGLLERLSDFTKTKK